LEIKEKNNQIFFKIQKEHLNHEIPDTIRFSFGFYWYKLAFGSIIYSDQSKKNIFF
jgi:hypothetical protein